MAQGGLQSDGASLRESREGNTSGRNTSPNFAFDQLFDSSLRLAHAFLVLLERQVLISNVVPRAHHVTTVDGNRLQRSVRKYESYGAGWKRQLIDNRYEVVSIGPESVHPDYREARI